MMEEKQKVVDEVKNAFAEARKHQKDDFIDEARDWFNQDITDLKNYKTDTLGVRVNARDFVTTLIFMRLLNHITVSNPSTNGSSFVPTGLPLDRAKMMTCDIFLSSNCFVYQSHKVIPY